MDSVKQEYIFELYQNVEILERKWIKYWNQNNQIGLSKSHIKILGILDANGSQRPSKLAEDLNITTGGITVLTNKLLDEGYISRTEDGRDRRVVNLEITSLGEDTLSLAQKEINLLTEKMFGNLTQKEVQTLVSLLRKLL